MNLCWFMILISKNSISRIPISYNIWICIQIIWYIIMIIIDTILYSWLYDIFPNVNNDTKHIFSYRAGTSTWHPDARKCVCRAAVCNPLSASTAIYLYSRYFSILVSLEFEDGCSQRLLRWLARDACIRRHVLSETGTRGGIGSGWRFCP